MDFRSTMPNMSLRGSMAVGAGGGGGGGGAFGGGGGGGGAFGGGAAAAAAEDLAGSPRDPRASLEGRGLCASPRSPSLAAGPVRLADR